MARWNSFGEYAVAVVRAVRDRSFDPRLSPQAAAPSTQSQESTGAEGGYLVPPDYRTEVAQKVLGDGSLIALTDLHRVTSNALNVPADALPPWSTSGPQVTVEGEGHALAQSKLKVELNALRLSKAQVLLPVTDEMLEDSPGLGAYLLRVVPARLTHKLNDWLVNGDGVSKPLGLLASGAKITQTKEGAQAAATVVLANTQKMYTRIPSSSLPTATWLAHPETAPQLQALGLPHYVNGQPPTLHGIPVRYVEVCAPLGTEGDLVLWDPLGYLSAVRAYASAANDIRTDASMDLWFDQGISALRFSLRVAGAPWVSAPWVRYKTATTVSHVVTVETRA